MADWLLETNRSVTFENDVSRQVAYWIAQPRAWVGNSWKTGRQWVSWLNLQV